MLRRILLALDYSDSGQVAVSFAVSLAAPGAEVRVVHVNEYVVGGHGLTIETAQEAARLADDAVSRLVSCGVQASACVRNTACFGVAELIVTAADSWAAEAIVLGSHRYRGLRRLRGQGVRDRVTRLTHLPVLTAPAPLRVGVPDLPSTGPGSPARRWRRTRPLSRPHR